MKHELLRKTFLGFPVLYIFVGVVLTVIFVVLVLRYRKLREYEYRLETLRSNGLANDKTVVKKDSIEFTNRSIADYRQRIDLICELWRNDSIIDFFKKGHELQFVLAKLPSKVSVPSEPLLNEIGVDHNNKRFAPTPVSMLLRASSRSGKTILMNMMIYSEYFASNSGSKKIIVGDAHGSFLKIRGLPDIEVYDFRNASELQDFHQRLSDIGAYQRSIDLSVHETLDEAKSKGEHLDKHGYLIIVDEFAEVLSPSMIKDPLSALKQNILTQLTAFVTGGLKYDIRVVLAYQDQRNSAALIHPGIFLGEITNYVDPVLAAARGAPGLASHPLIRTVGNFLYTGKYSNPTFFRVPLITKADLPGLLARRGQK